MFNHRQIFFDKKHNQSTFLRRISCDRGSMCSCYSVPILLIKAIQYPFVLYYFTVSVLLYIKYKWIIYKKLHENGVKIDSYTIIQRTRQ